MTVTGHVLMVASIHRRFLWEPARILFDTMLAQQLHTMIHSTPSAEKIVSGFHWQTSSTNTTDESNAC